MPKRSGPIRIATRSSEFALRQARQVQAALAARGIESELETYRTAGDRKLDVPLSAIGAKGLFTQELEHDLELGRVDCCVHSLKDLPTEMPRGLEIVALLPREDPRDALVMNHLVGAASIGELPPGSRVGTSSLRRRAQLMLARRDLEVVELRGNVPTRLRKVDDGLVHAAILAAAGLHRLDARQRISGYLDAPAWLPAPGQGAIAVQIRADDPDAHAWFGSLADEQTTIDARAERAFLGALEGGCQVPIGAAVVRDAAGVALHGLIADVAGTKSARASLPLDAAQPELTGVRLANELRRLGATEILESLRREERVPAPQPE